MTEAIKHPCTYLRIHILSNPLKLFLLECYSEMEFGFIRFHYSSVFVVEIPVHNCIHSSTCITNTTLCFVKTGNNIRFL